jgi:hypothetical protein
VSALVDPRVAEYVNEHFVATYLKVGTFQIIGGKKVGGNVASYFCLFDGSVLHAVAGPVNAAQFLSEARWAVETRKAALTLGTKLATGELDLPKYRAYIKQAHEERYVAEGNPWMAGAMPKPILKNQPKAPGQGPLPPNLPRLLSRQAQVHWLLAHDTLAPIDRIYPFVWEQILNERLSGLPVAQK